MHRALASYVREAIWKFFYDRNRDVPFEMPWHRELKVRLNLGNELSRALFVDGCYDANEFAFLDSILRPGMHFMDIGAHEGLYTLFASRCVGDNDMCGRSSQVLGNGLAWPVTSNSIASTMFRSWRPQSPKRTAMVS